MAEEYLRKQQECEHLIQRMSGKVNRLGLVRVLVFVIAFCGFALGIVDKRSVALGVGVACLLVFVVLVVIYHKLEERLLYQKAYGEVLERYIKRFSDDWTDMPDDGKAFLEVEDAPYIEAGVDLDLFGRASLFQYLNVAVSSRGRARLGSWLVAHVSAGKTDSAQKAADMDMLRQRQAAVAELKEKEALSLRLEALAILTRSKREDAIQERLSIGMEEIAKDRRQSGKVMVLACICVLLTLAALVLGICHMVSFSYLIVMLLVQFVLSQAMDGMLFAGSYGAFSYLRYLSRYQKFMQTLAAEEYESALLKTISGEVRTDSSQGIARLNTIGEALNMRHNPIVYGLLCMVCFYNAFVYVMYVRWKAEYGERVEMWMDSIATTEALLSLAVVARTREHICYPAFVATQKPYVKMDAMCHLLIQERNVVGNDVCLDNQLRLVTGSNMSGKTTYLRTLGVNLVLAYAGAPVCAASCELSDMELFTSMRVVDDVSHGISTFYAEVLRIKHMITFSKQELPMLVLIDEIFKGTNSADRIVGATGVIQALCQPWVNGMVSTHDFELCQLAQQQPMLTNYHFDEYFEEEQLKFSYVIKEGRCTTTNALHILKMAGIYKEQSEGEQ